MPKKSAGILLYKVIGGELQVFLIHPGGPFWAKNDDGAWSIPKGAFEDGEDPLSAAKREFEEEVGSLPAGELIELTPLPQPSGKVVYAWAIQAGFDPTTLKSSTFQIEWPPRSGKLQEYPEVDRAGWFPFELARRKIRKGQVGFLGEVEGLSV